MSFPALEWAAGGKANKVTIQGLTIEKYATPFGSAAVGCCPTGLGPLMYGADWLIKSNEVQWNHAAGLALHFGWQVIHNYLHGNGNWAITGTTGGGNADGTGTLPSRILIQGPREASMHGLGYLIGPAATTFTTAQYSTMVTRGLRGNVGKPLPNLFDYNAYHLPDLNRRAFAWDGGPKLTFAKFQAAGQDVHGIADARYTSSYPTVSILSPADGSTVSGIANIVSSARVTGSTICKVELYVDWARPQTDSRRFELCLGYEQDWGREPHCGRDGLLRRRNSRLLWHRPNCTAMSSEVALF